jgi:hypothetical protein
MLLLYYSEQWKQTIINKAKSYCLCIRCSLLFNDIASLRNMYSLPLNIWVVIDQFFSTRNIAYAFHDGEKAEDHDWALDCLFGVLPPVLERVYFSDFDKGLEAAISKRSGIWHGRCLHHLEGNITKNLVPTLGPLFQPFREAFWAVYYSPSPAAFERSWNQLLEDFPDAQPYLQAELWPTRARWAWPFVATRFTCGVRTSGRVEGENSVNKLLGNVKTTLYDLAMKLMARTEQQTDMEVMRIRQVGQILVTSSPITFSFFWYIQASRLRHPSQTDILFARPLAQLRKHCRPYAVQKSYNEMESSVFYTSWRIEFPEGIATWVRHLCSFVHLCSLKSSI